MIFPDILCPCSEAVVKSVNADSSKVRAKVLIIKEDSVYAVCKSCNFEVALPLRIDYSLINPPLILEE